MQKRHLVFSLLVLAAPPLAAAQTYAAGEEGTFSIIARDPVTMELGMAVQSHTIASGARSPGGKGGIAVIAHQAASDPMYDAIGIQLLENGMTPQQALDMMLRSDPDRDHRQVSILDIQGRSASWTGPANSDWKGSKCGLNYCAQGNTLAGPGVVNAMARSFESSSGPLAERLLDALDSGEAEGGDKRGMESAALLVLKPLTQQGFGDRELDLRVDQSSNPFVELRRILNGVRSEEMVRLGNQKLAANDLPGALRLDMDAEAKSPSNDGAPVALAIVHLRMGQKEDALTDIRRAVEINPANKKQLQLNKNFASLDSDPEFLSIVNSH
jgi:uncharacterized Ntn-hydrolase superfamily protein